MTQNTITIDGAITINDMPANNIEITEIGGTSILVYKETAIELAHAILRKYGLE